jgi:hypothetical protein
MAQVAVPMPGGETRWLNQEERDRIALKYGPPHRWKDPNPTLRPPAGDRLRPALTGAKAARV